MPEQSIPAAGRRHAQAISALVACVSLIIAAFAVLVWRFSTEDHRVSNPIPYRTLEDAENLPRSPSITYRSNLPQRLSYSVVDPSIVAHPFPDTTVVILNWSRFPNVRRITSLLCSPSLRGVVKEILVWNNHPDPLSYHDFVDTACPRSQLKVYNSPENLYFLARFLGCAQATTTYCYTQDDDYIVLPEIIWTLRSRIAESPAPFAIHLLPPHEHLSTDLRIVHNNRNLHVSFAWLGHGTIMHQSQAADFLELLRLLKASDVELKMADNYFSLLSNTIPEVWFDQGIELAGGQAYTVGEEGDTRNKFHILKAARYLDSLLLCENMSCEANIGQKLPYVDQTPLDVSPIHRKTQRAPCAGRPCLFETSIGVLPLLMHHGARAEEMLNLEQRNQKALREDERFNYFNRPPSLAVDGRPETAFHSLNDAKVEDYIALDMLTADIGHVWSDLTMAWLVPLATEDILMKCVFETSLDGHTWTESQDVSVSCADAFPISDGAYQLLELRECSVQMKGKSSGSPARFFRGRLLQDVAQRWVVHEVWMRGRRD